MEYKEFYVKYLENQPVKINTHVNNDKTALRILPLTNVGDLIAAYKTAVAPLLDHFSLAQLTLHLPENADRSTLLGDAFAPTADSTGGSDGPLTLHLPVNESEFLPGNTLLTSFTGAGSYNSPLVIRSLNTITMDEYMVLPLPQPVYDNPVSRPNTSGTFRKRPTHVLLWSNFIPKVCEWIEANHHQHSQRVDRPVFVSGIIITEEVQTLQPFIKLNLLDVSAKCFIPTSQFKARRQIPNCVGEPDHLLTRNGEIVAIVEEKGKWSLPTGDIVNSYTTNRACESAVNQLYQYMRLNHRKYGILSSYENTWFLYRSQEGFEDSQVYETLYVSEGISFTAETPTVQQCLAYFNSIADNVHMVSPPTSKRPSRANSATQIPDERGSRVSPNASTFIGSSSSSSIQINEPPQDFNIDDFKFDTVLGEGRSKVYLDYHESNHIALKVADIAKHREMLPELLNEVSMYEQLSGLQGNGIPRFICHGFVEDILYCVGFSVCGSVATGFTEQQKQKLVETLQSIHKVGILHNDIKKENILIDISGKPYIIDFGFASQNFSPVAQMEELNILLSLIDSNFTQNNKTELASSKTLGICH